MAQPVLLCDDLESAHVWKLMNFVRFRLKPFLLLLLLFAVGFVQEQSAGWEWRVCAEPRSLPFSNRQGQGFENKVAEILARELRAKLTYVWLPQPHTRARDLYLELGRCDAIMGIPDGTDGFLTTLAYYRTSYVFLYKRGSSGRVASFDDPKLKGLRIGVQASGGNISPVSVALAKRGLVEQQHTFSPDFAARNPLATVVQAVARGEVDVGVVWGPVAGYFAGNHAGLEWVPVSPQIEIPFVPFVTSMSIGLRPGDEDFRDLLDDALAKHWDEIQSLLESYRVPLEPLPSLSPTALNRPQSSAPAPSRQSR